MRLSNKYKLVFLNEETLEERASFNLRPLKVFVAIGLTVILLIVLTTILIAFTPLREYIPGYSDVKTKRMLYNLVLKTDSMQTALNARDSYIDNIKNIVNGDVHTEVPKEKTGKAARFDTIHSLKKSSADAALRNEIEKSDIYTLGINSSGGSQGISGFLFFPPMKGTVTNRFNATAKHYGIDIAGNSNEAIKATLDGTVIIANFTSETGYVIAIQHSNNLISFYKHNSALLKKPGDFVEAGDPIAVIGNSGELTSGPHLHFELWYNGTALDPQKYVAF